MDFQARFPELCEGPTSQFNNSDVGVGVPGKFALTSLSQPCLPVSNRGPTKILPFVYLGSLQDAMDHETLLVRDETLTFLRLVLVEFCERIIIFLLYFLL